MSITERVHFFPVRHHSPACAFKLRQYAQQIQPSAILIEGPSEYNKQLHELFFDHRLPIAIYTYAGDDEHRFGAYHPFCIYSPEWQALQIAKELKSMVKFIDLPWTQICHLRIQNSQQTITSQEHRYADSELRKSHYIHRLCQTMHVDDFDALWDELFEVDVNETNETFIKRVKEFCKNVRLFEQQDNHAQNISDDPINSAREAFMLSQIQACTKEIEGDILVVTGGYHTSVLEDSLTTASVQTASDHEWIEHGAALTPYSYERLDSLTGYQSGMPAPYFYHTIWHTYEKKIAFDESHIIDTVAKQFRKRKLTFSTADRIAAQTHIRALAMIRSHKTPWRSDIFDGLSSTTIKDEIVYGGYHPMHDVIHQVFRGEQKGLLDTKTSLPPLTHHIDQYLTRYQLTPNKMPNVVELDLYNQQDRERNQFLRRLLLLDISGFKLIESTDMAMRDSLVEVKETWEIRWTPDFDSGKIEAAKYGATLDEAANRCLLEKIHNKTQLEQSADLLITAALCGLGQHADNIFHALSTQVSQCGDFNTVVKVLGHLVYLRRYDEVLILEGLAKTESLLVDTYERALWLLDSLGRPSEASFNYVTSINSLLYCFNQFSEDTGWSSEALAEIFIHICKDDDQLAEIRGAALGCCFLLEKINSDDLQPYFLKLSSAEHLGDFLTGLFHIARETIQRNPILLEIVDHIISQFDTNAFLTSLPSLRMAFTYFTPREKHYIINQLFSGSTDVDINNNDEFSASTEDIQTAMHFESQISNIARNYGVDLSPDDQQIPATQQARHQSTPPK